MLRHRQARSLAALLAWIGYPNHTFRGNQALSRYEFAAGLNACLDRMGELLPAATNGLVTQEDLEKFRRAIALSAVNGSSMVVSCSGIAYDFAATSRH